MELKKGSWSDEEDNILINYIRLNGHTNWRALPKHAGLFRCGKSCRLRWMNYLRPDIKRGNFTPEEEEAIINLHEMLGNRWSAIAARLPGRTDNEIKNVWHSQLKKRLRKIPNHGSTTTMITTTIASAMAINVAAGPTRKRCRKRKANGSEKTAAPKKLVSIHESSMELNDNDECANNNSNTNSNSKNVEATWTSSIIKIEPQTCTSEVSTVTSSNNTSNSNDSTTTYNHMCQEDNTGGNSNQDSVEGLVDINDEFWMDILSVGNTSMCTEDFRCMSRLEDQNFDMKPMIEPEYSNVDQFEVMDVLWYNSLAKSQDLLGILDLL